MKIFFRLLVLTTLLPGQKLQAQITAIKTGFLIDPYSNEVLENKIILIEGRKIVSITDNITNVKTDQIYDLSDSWVTPGLIDCHVHLTLNLTYRNSDLLEKYVTESDSYRVLRGAHNARLLLLGGFTTVKEIGNDGNYVTAELIKAIANGWTDGPHIQYAGKIIAPYGGQILTATPEHDQFRDYEYISADSQDEIRKAIRKNVYNGASTIKLATGDQKYFYSREDVSFAVSEAAKAGLKVNVHAGGGEAAKNAILGGAASIEHGFFLSEELLKLMKESGTFLVGTDFSFTNWYSYGMSQDNAKSLYETTKRRLKLAYDLGVKMAFGTDIVVDVEGMNRLESNLEVLETWKEAGVPSMYILKCMTSNAAELLGIETTKGRIAIGNVADIVAYKSNPLEDIKNIRTTKFVMKEGKVFRNDL